jgi:hypothetical protein
VPKVTFAVFLVLPCTIALHMHATDATARYIASYVCYSAQPRLQGIIYFAGNYSQKEFFLMKAPSRLWPRHSLPLLGPYGEEREVYVRKLANVNVARTEDGRCGTSRHVCSQSARSGPGASLPSTSSRHGSYKKVGECKRGGWENRKLLCLLGASAMSAYTA